MESVPAICLSTPGFMSACRFFFIAADRSKDTGET
jgi:hypothetical protein